MHPRLLRTFVLLLALLASTATGAPAQSPSDEVADLVESGLNLLAADNHLSAAKKFQKARELSDSKRPEPFLGFAALEIFRGNYVNAVAAAGNARALAEDAMGQARADHLIGVAYLRLTWALAPGPKRAEALRQAEVILREALEASGGKLNEIRLDLARVFAVTDRPDADEAIALVREYLANQPEDEVDLEARGLLCWFEFAAGPSYQSPAGELQRPKKVSSPQILLTKAAREAGVVGAVSIGAIIDEEGRICAHVRAGMPYGQTEATLAEVIDRWKFEPATYDGKPIPIVYHLTINLRE